MNINGTELELDIWDADTLDRYNEEVAKLNEALNGISRELSAGDNLRAQCSIVNAFFDGMFGVGTAEELFDGKNNLRIHLDAFASLIDEIKRQQDEYSEIVAKYMPNRAQRRAKNGK